MPDTLKEYDEIIKTGFEARWEHDKKIAALTAKHIDPVKKLLKIDWDNLANDSGIEKKDLSLDYAKYRRHQQALGMEEDDRERIQDAQRIIHHAMAKNSMLDMFDGTVTEFTPRAITEDNDMKAGEKGGDEAEAIK